MTGDRRPIPADEAITPLMAIDLETTGLSPRRGHRVIEIAAVRIEDGKAGAVFHSLIDAGRPIVKRAQRNTGITDAMLRRGVSPGEALRNFRTFCGKSTLVAHNAPFVRLFLQYEFSRFGWGFPNRVICTQDMCRQHFPDLPDHRLLTVAKHLLGDSAVEGRNSHRALDDAHLTARIWLALATKNNQGRPLGGQPL